MSNWIEIGVITDIPKLGSRVVNTPEGDIAVFRNAENEVFALRAECPHKKGALSQGIVHGKAVTCPLHNWVFDMTTGLAQGADDGAVRTWPVRVEAGRILITTDLIARSRAA